MTQRLKGLSRRWKALGGAALIALVVLVPLQLAGAVPVETGEYKNGAGSAGFTIDQGTITLRMNPVADTTGSKSYFRYMAPDGTEKTIQKFKSSGRCGYAVTAGNLVAVTAETPNAVGYREADNGYGLGVSKNGTEGTGSCTQTNPGESLSLHFNGLAPDTFLDYAELDVELKYTNTKLLIDLYKDQTQVYAYSLTCGLSDCGPDSGGNDNKRIRVPTGMDTVLFNRMVITVSLNGGSQAGATLEGGSDVGTSPSIFHTVTPATPIECGTDIQDPTDPTGGTDATVTFVIIEGSDGCPTGKGYVLHTATNRIELVIGGATVPVRSVVRSVWDPRLTRSPVPVSIVSPACEVPADGCTPLATAEETEVWCLGAFNMGDAPSASNLDGTYGASMPPGHVWCRITQSTQIVDPVNDLMQITEFSLLEADAVRRAAP